MNTPTLLVTPEIIASNVIVCGDPGRAERIAGMMDEAREVAANREYRSFTGSWKGAPVSVVSHGIGAAGAAICFEELIRVGAKRIIRVGTAGSYTADLPPGSLVISVAAAREDGLTRQLVPSGFPAVADRAIVDALRTAATGRPVTVGCGITLTMDMFYEGAVPFPHHLYKQAGVLAVEMENAALFVIASLRGVQAGAILALDGYADADLAKVYNPHTETVQTAVRLEAEIALDALVQLHKQS